MIDPKLDGRVVVVTGANNPYGIGAGVAKIIGRAMAKSYYSSKLAAERLKRCYEIAPLRIRRYLRAEVEFVLENVRRSDLLLDLGCGYGRTMRDFAAKAIPVKFLTWGSVV